MHGSRKTHIPSRFLKQGSHLVLLIFREDNSSCMLDGSLEKAAGREKAALQVGGSGDGKGGGAGLKHHAGGRDY